MSFAYFGGDGSPAPASSNEANCNSPLGPSLRNMVTRRRRGFSDPEGEATLAPDVSDTRCPGSKSISSA